MGGALRGPSGRSRSSRAVLGRRRVPGGLSGMAVRVAAPILALALLLSLAVPAGAQEDNDLYRMGVDAFADGLFDMASGSFTELDERHRDSPLRADANFLLALSYYHLGEHEKSLELLETFAGKFPDAEHVAVLDHWRAANLLALGQAAEAEGRMGDAIALASEAAVLAGRQLESTEAPETYPARTRLLHAAALFQVGQLAYRGGRYAQAVAAFERIVFAYDESPWAPHALFALAEASLAAGELQRAAERLTRYLELFPGGELAAAAQARLPFVYLALERFSEAAEAAEVALRSEPGGELTARLLQVQGEAALQLGDTDRAASALSAALDAGLDPAGEQRAAYHLALAHLQSGQRLLGLASLQRASSGPDAQLAASAALNRAFLLIEGGELAAGAGALQRFADAYPNHPRLGEALKVLAQTREALGETEASLDAWERLSLVIEAEGGAGAFAAGASDVPVATLLRAADAAVAIDQDDRALVLLARLRKRSPEAVYRIGRIYGARGEHMRAAGFYREVVRAAPLPSELASRARLALGAELFNAGRYQEALTHLRDGGGGVWEPYRHLALGRVYYRLGESDEAIDALAVAAFAPDAVVAAEASYLYAAAQFQGGRFEQALDGYLQFTDRFPESARVPSAYYRAALSELRVDRPQEATKLFTAALETIESREARARQAGTADGRLAGAGGVDLAQEILFMLVDGALAAGRVGEAEDAVTKLRARAPAGLLAGEAGLRYGEYLVAHGLQEAGLRALRQVAADHGEAGTGRRALLAAAQAADALGRSAEAADLYWRTLLAAHDTGLREQALVGLRASFAPLGPAGAERYYLAAKQSDDADLPAAVRARVLHDYALLIHPEQPESAAAILQRALPDLSPGAARDDAYFLLAETYKQADQPQRAVEAYRVVAAVAVAGGGRQAEADLCLALLTVEMDGAGATANELANVALRYPAQDEIAAEALYGAVALLQAAGAERSARRLRDRLMQRYPQSAWAALVRDPEQEQPDSVCS